MAIAIKSVPVLKDTAAVSFNNKAQDAINKKSTITFSKQFAVYVSILNKAKI